MCRRIVIAAFLFCLVGAVPAYAYDAILVAIANPASENCVKNGGKLVIKKDAQGGEYGECTLPNGIVCEEWALFRGECPQKGQKK